MAVVNSFHTGVDGQNYTPNTYSLYADMIGKLARQFIRNVESKNSLAVFDKGRIENGDTIEQVVIGLLESQGYDLNGANTLTPKQTNNMVARYWNDWQKKVYKQTIRPEQIRKITPSNEVDETSELARKLIASLDFSAEHEHFVAFKELLSWGVQNSQIVSRTAVVLDDNGKINYKGIIKEIKNVIDGMQFVSNAYNGASFTTKTNKDDIMLVIPFEVMNMLDVDELAGVFNLSKTELDARIIKTDATDKKIYVLDKNAILSFTREYEIRTQENAEGNFWNYFLHTERLMTISPLFNAVCITYAEPEE